MRKHRMVILHVAAISDDMVGGPVESVPRLVSAQNEVPGVTTALLISAPGGKRYTAISSVPVFHIEDLPSLDVQHVLPDPFARPDVIVFHSTYIPSHLTLARWARKRHIPYIVSPRGGLTPTAQKEKSLKKRIANVLVFRRYLAAAAGVHCLTEGEANSARAWHRKVFIVGNGADLPDLSDEYQSPRSGLRLSYVGRLDIHIKGLDLMLQGLGTIREQLREEEVKVVLYGPDEGGARETLSGLIARLNLADIVSLGGVVYGSEKRQVLLSSDVFLHTSRSEGHPMAVLEALSHAVPCLLTPGTHMAEIVEDAGAGWKVEPVPESIAAGVLHAMRLRTSLGRYRANARRLAESRFQWSTVAEDTLVGYHEIIGNEI